MHGVLVQGAVENILERSDRIVTSSGAVVKLDATAKSLVLQSLNKMASRALRCLALAYTDKLGPLDGYNGEKHRGHALLLDSSKYSSIESGLVLVGMVGLEVRMLSRSYPIKTLPPVPDSALPIWF